ncbi:MAG: DUF4179 domain-containing protein [Escherichia coli]|jgi:hypothetical protein|nr:DUF4179 domain-containing protein [Escherichia coli]
MSDIEKDLRNLANAEDIEIPKSLRNKVNHIYKIIEKENSKKNKIRKSIRVASGLVVFLLGINFIKPTLAEEIPLVGPVLKVLNENLGLGIKYTENGLVVNKDFKTENYNVNIETVDFNGDKLLIVYKVEPKKDIYEVISYSLDIEVEGSAFKVKQGDSLSTGRIENNVYYGYSVLEITFEDIYSNNEELKVNILPIGLNITTNNEEIKEKIENGESLSLIIKNKNYR